MKRNKREDEIERKKNELLAMKRVIQRIVCWVQRRRNCGLIICVCRNRKHREILKGNYGIQRKDVEFLCERTGFVSDSAVFIAAEYSDSFGF